MCIRPISLAIPGLLKTMIVLGFGTAVLQAESLETGPGPGTTLAEQGRATLDVVISPGAAEETREAARTLADMLEQPDWYTRRLVPKEVVEREKNKQCRQSIRHSTQT